MLLKIQVFAWRCMKDILPVCANLVGRFVDVDLFCKRCGSEVETAKHALRDCKWVADLWASTSLQLPLGLVGEEVSTISDWIHSVLHSLTADIHGIFFTLLRMFWFARNKLYFDNLKLRGEFFIIKAQTLISEFFSVQARSKKGPSRGIRSPNRWVPPVSGWIKINSNASVNLVGRIGIGRVAHNSEGVVIWYFVESILQSSIVETAEAVALLRCMELVSAQRLDRVIFEVDSQVLCNVVLFPKADISIFDTIVEDICRMLSGLLNVRVCWSEELGILLHTV